jgi:survival-of-motor-neuron-related-splicing factor 30
LTKELLDEATVSKHGPGQVSEKDTGPVAAITTAPEVRVPSVLPPQIKDQIRIAQRRAALAGHAPAEWAIGSQIQAKFSGDGVWYDAEVTAISTSGKFIVTYTKYGTQDEVELPDIRNIEDQFEVTDHEYKGVTAPKRNTVKDSNSLESLEQPPAWMHIKSTDDEKTKQKKKKLLKSFKSKQRFQKMDLEQKKKADNWKSFLTSKATKKSGGLNKKKSMFSMTSGGKIGVAKKH